MPGNTPKKSKTRAALELVPDELIPDIYSDTSAGEVQFCRTQPPRRKERRTERAEGYDPYNSGD